jgi:DNA-binding CsgD family transcriptional regulator
MPPRGRSRAATNWWPPTNRSSTRGAPLARNIDEALDVAKYSAPIVIRREPASPLIAYVLPVSLSTFGADAFVGARALILLIDQEPNAPADPALVRDLLELTLGEARVASLIGAGRTPRDAAAALGITEETTRTVLKRIYTKVGISRQSELTAVLARATFPTA